MALKIATHASDIDGLVSAALFLIKYPDAEIEFLKIGDLKDAAQREYDYVLDLPKLPNAKINIDHHASNYNRLRKSGNLTDRDIVDPKAPSAATLVIRYLGLLDNKVARELLAMAEKADTGNHDKNTIKLDLIIKCANGDQEKLIKIAKKLSQVGSKILKDPWIKKEWKRIEKHYKRGEKIAKDVAKKFSKMGIKNAIIDLKSGFPRIAFGSIAHQFMKHGGEVIVVINRMEEEDNLCPSPNKKERERQAKFSFRVSNNTDFDSRMIAEKLNGGGHVKASGGRVPIEEYPSALLKIIKEFSKRGIVGYYLIDLHQKK
ncbi:MAG: DHHA1 domain-containing protein [Candidatus Njordarchaeia archaeon]